LALSFESKHLPLIYADDADPSGQAFYSKTAQFSFASIREIRGKAFAFSLFV
jgi:hypothetical protein